MSTAKVSQCLAIKTQIVERGSSKKNCYPLRLKTHSGDGLMRQRARKHDESSDSVVLLTGDVKYDADVIWYSD